MTDSLETSEREAFEPRMLRLPVVEMAAEPAPPPVAAGFEAHPVGTGKRLRRLEREKAELVKALSHTKQCLEIANERGDLLDTLWAGDCETLFDYIDAALTSATKETT